MKQAHTDWWDMSSSYIHKIMGKIIQANWSLPFLRQQKSDLDNNDKCTAIPGAGTYQRGVGEGVESIFLLHIFIKLWKTWYKPNDPSLFLWQQTWRKCYVCFSSGVPFKSKRIPLRLGKHAFFLYDNIYVRVWTRFCQNIFLS